MGTRRRPERSGGRHRSQDDRKVAGWGTRAATAKFGGAVALFVSGYALRAVEQPQLGTMSTRESTKLRRDARSGADGVTGRILLAKYYLTFD
ncbi:hypothetical protein DP117_34365 [Brasilonema sp. UFV-L1]|nr:hypothetical protein [Brasilonema sp. UFV-L1]